MSFSLVEKGRKKPWILEENITWDLMVNIILENLVFDQVQWHCALI